MHKEQLKDIMRKVLFTGFILIFCFSCSNDLEMNASLAYQPVAYCLLDLNSEIQYVRVSRSYQSDASNFGKSPPADSLIITEPCEIYIEKWTDGDLAETYLFSTTTLPRDSGFFPVRAQEWYAAAFKPQAFTRYLLYIYFPEIDKVVSAETVTTGFPMPEDPQPELPRFITITRDRGYTLRWHSVEHSGVYEGIFTVNYLETLGDDTEYHSVQWKLPNINLYEPDEIISQEINPNHFFHLLLDNIPVKPEVERELVGMEFSLASGGEELALAIRSAEIRGFSALSDYTNMDNGIGLFSSLARAYVRNLAFSYLTEDAVCSDEQLKPLNFKRKGSHE